MERVLDIVMVGSSAWRSVGPLNCHHLARRLGEAGHRVLYVEPPALRVPNPLHGPDLVKIVRRFKGWAVNGRGDRGGEAGAGADGGGVHVVSPLLLPGVGRLADWNGRRLRAAVSRHAARLGMRRPLLWSFLPIGRVLVGALDEAGVIYHCVDDYAGNPGVDAVRFEAAERAMIREAGLCLATSQPLAQQLEARGAGSVACVPNVGEVERFERPAGPMPADLAAIAGPRIGYVGNIAGYKVDLDLLYELARARPQWSLVLIGGIGGGDPGTRVSRLARLANVHLLGPRDYAELPGYVQHLDVCLIPFRSGRVTDCSLPLKTFEYLAAGRPVVSTPVASLRAEPLEGVIRYADAKGGFVEAIEAALGDDDADARERRRAAARPYSWTQRFEQLQAMAFEMAGDAAGPAGSVKRHSD